MSADICPHCTHKWKFHGNRCHYGQLGAERCGCMWQQPRPAPPPLTEHDIAVSRLANMLWDAFEAVADGDGPFTPYVDREMDMIDGSGAGVNMTAVAEHLYAALNPEEGQ